MLQPNRNPFYLTEAQIAHIENLYQAMTPEERIGQLFCLIAYRDDDAYFQEMMQHQPGGVMLRPMPTPAVVASVRKLQQASRYPLLLAANLEKGGNGLLSDGTNYASPMEIAATDDPDMASRLGRICASEAARVGINWAFAPIIDLDRNFRNPITNTRTFGSDPRRVSAMGRAYVQAVQQGGLAASIKHFPGDGCDERDQHLAPTVNPLSCEEWDQTYGQVYRDCIRAGAMTVMVGHILQPAWSRRLNPALADRELLPGSLSRELVTGLLKERLGFEGLVVTDATTMAGFNMMAKRSDLVPAAIAAGCDMFLFCKNLDEDFAFMRQGVEQGVITPERLHDAVTKVLALKTALRLFEKQTDGTLLPEANAAPTQQELGLHDRWAIECARKSVTLVKEEPGVLPLSPAKTPRILLYPLQAEQGVIYSAASGVMEQIITLLTQEGFQVSVFTPNPNGLEGLMDSQKAYTDRYDLMLYIANLATKSNQTTVRIEWAQPMGANVPSFLSVIPTVFVSVENPYHLLDVPRVRTYINTYHSSPHVLRALVNKLMGREPFEGKSPVDPFCGMWDTHL